MARKRSKISSRVRFEVFRRDLFTCQYCGRNPPAVLLQLDHITAHSKGGSDGAGNLVTSCEECNRGKGDLGLKEVPPSLKAEMQRKKDRAEQIGAYNALLIEIRNQEEEAVKSIGRYWNNHLVSDKDRDRWVFGRARSASIKVFLKELMQAEILEAVDIAMSRKEPRQDYDEIAWRYFCGICWRTIKRRRGEEGEYQP